MCVIFKLSYEHSVSSYSSYPCRRSASQPLPSKALSIGLVGGEREREKGEKMRKGETNKRKSMDKNLSQRTNIERKAGLEGTRKKR